MQEGLLPAKITDRFLAFVLDVVPFMVGYHVSLYVLIVQLEQFPNTTTVWRAAAAAWLVLYFLYQIAGNALTGTVGKRMFGIRIVAPDGTPLGAGRSIVRALGYLLSTPMMNLGFLWSLFDKDSRTWHDLLSGSVVIEEMPKPPIAAFGSAVLSLILIIFFFVGNAMIIIREPSPRDKEAISKAREGLKVLAAIEEAYKVEHGVYTDNLVDIAKASGNVGQFKEAMEHIFHSEGFVFRVTEEGYVLRARAKDRYRTPVMLEGP